MPEAPRLFPKKKKKKKKKIKILQKNKKEITHPAT
jgi:hypothetical protein